MTLKLDISIIKTKAENSPLHAISSRTFEGLSVIFLILRCEEQDQESKENYHK